jgi:hypothetical protein
LVRVTGRPDFVKMLDFGVRVDATLSARAMGSDVVGIPNYMAPEQAYGCRDLDHRVDQFALAAIAYELLSGEKAFPGATTTDALQAVVSGAPPQLSAVAPGVPNGFERVLRRALSKPPEDRYPSIAAFASAFAKAALESGLEVVGRPSSGPSSGRYSMAPNATEDLRPPTLRPLRASEPPVSMGHPLSIAAGTVSSEPDGVATLETVLQMVRHHWRAGRLDDAVACAEHLLELAAYDKRASVIQAVGSAIPLLDAIFEACTGGAGARLLPGPRLAELRQTLSAHAARLVAYVVGPTTVAALLAMSNMPRRDGIRMIAGLLRRGALAQVASVPGGPDTP